MSHAKVVHCRRDVCDVYVGRPSKWGNPFPVDRSAERRLGPAYRLEILRRYEEWLTGKPELLAALPELRGKVLGCWCAPKPCHADVLLRLANEETTT